MQVRCLRAHFISRQDWLFFLLHVLICWLILFHRRGRGKAVRVVQMMHRIIHMDNATIVMSMRTGSTLTLRACGGWLLRSF
jgi:hypothetical protein